MIYDEEHLEELIIEVDSEDKKALAEIYQTIKEMRPLKAHILKKVKCKRCGWCCRICNVMLTKQDITKLCTYLKFTFEQLYERYMDKNARMPYLKMPCPFLNKNNECDIYYIRPRVCKEFPFNEFVLVVDPCNIGKEIRNIIEEEEGPIIPHIDKDIDEFIAQRDNMVDYFINSDKSNTQGSTLHMILYKGHLQKLMGIIKRRSSSNGNK